MTTIEVRLVLQNVEGTQSVISLPGMARTVNSGYNGATLWRQLPRDPGDGASVTPINTDTGLLSPDCSAMQSSDQHHRPAGRHAAPAQWWPR